MADSPHRTDDDTTLERSIGTGMLLLFVIGNILGAGIYAVVGEVASSAGGLLWLSFLGAALLATFTAASYAELTTKYRQAGGAALYAQKAFGRPWLTLVTAIAVAAAAVTSAATSARALADDYLSTFVELPVIPVAICFIAVLSVVNWWGINESLRANAVLTGVIIVGLLVVAGVGIWALVGGDAELDRLTATPDDASVWPLAVLGGASLAFFAFVGFEDTAQIAEEAADPKRSYPIALGLGIAVTLLIYLLVAAATAVVIGEELGGSDAPLVSVVEQASAIPGETVAAVAIVALTNTALLQLVAASRLLYGVARRELLHPAFRTVDESRKTPWLAIVTVGALAAVLATTGGLATLADTTVLLLLTVFVVVNLSVLVLHDDEVEHDHVTVPRVVPVIGALVSAGLAVWSAIDNGLPVLLRAGALLALGLIVWIGQRTVAETTDVLDVDDIDGLEPRKVEAMQGS